MAALDIDLIKGTCINMSPSVRATTVPLSIHGRLPDAVDTIAAQSSNYLALGCLCFEDFPSLNLEPGIWQDVWTATFQPLDTSLSIALSRLLHHQWIRVQVSRCTLRPHWRICRISVLFHDVGVGIVDRNSKQLASALELLLQEINVDPRTWNGQHIPENFSSFDTWATMDAGNPSLFHVFNTIPSPNPLTNEIKDRYTKEVLEDLLDEKESIHGLKTPLYAYQRRAAGAMLHRESTSSLNLDLRLEKRTAVDGQSFYYNARDIRFLRDPLFQPTSRGGILAESMGLGKTLICLALILATKCFPPKMPVEHATTLTLTRATVGSLADMAISTINRNSIPWKVEFERLRAQGVYMSSCEARLEEQPPRYEVPHVPLRWNRKTCRRPPQRLIMASTTLLIVPPNLLRQWVSEIDKHVESGALKLLILDDRKKLLPSPDEVRLYDIVLFTRNRFDLEVQDGQDSDGRRMSSQAPLVCTCPYKGATRQRMCNCVQEKDLYSSPLKQMHFKRLIVDEGHFFSASRNTSTFIVANNLVRADYRWVVSGTPAKDLFGSEVQLDTMSGPRLTFDEHDKVGAVESLTALISNFLNASPWAVGDAKHYIYRHESFKEKTYSGFSTAFRRMLEDVVIKTRPEDVMRDIELPSITHEVVLLPPSFYDKLTANLFTLVLTANAVTSERTDADYLFHRNSAKARLQLISNLRQSAFFWSGFSEADVYASIKNSTSYLEKEGTNCSPKDRALLSQTLDCARETLECEGWKAMSRSHELGVFVDNWPENSAEHWSFEGIDPLLTGLSQLLDAQKFVNFRAGNDDPGEGLAGFGIRALAPARLPEVKSSHLASTAEADSSGMVANTTDKKPVLNKAGIPTSSLLGEPSLKRRASQVASPTKSSRPRRAKFRKKDGIKSEHSMVVPGIESGSEERDVSAPPSLTLPDDSPYAWANIVGTTSAKLSYLLSQILQHSCEEKILVFYQGDNAAFYISQFLELFNIKHEIYAKSLTADKKAQYVASFQEKEELRVLLMDVGQAAFGLNICAASRVYFINPICRPHLEAQAIKRAHRIGQTRKVTVETLVLQDSIEEKMLDRSKRMTRAEHQNAKVLENDGGIRAIIQSAQVLSMTEEEQVSGFGQMAPLSKPERLWCRPGWQTGTVAASPKRKVKRPVLVDGTGPDLERVVHDER